MFVFKIASKLKEAISTKPAWPIIYHYFPALHIFAYGELNKLKNII